MENKVRPFSSGSQFIDWTAANCDRCTRGCHRLSENAPPDCPLELALFEACFDDGTITAAVAERIGYAAGEYCWQCGEWDPTQAWIAEWNHRHAEEEK